MFFGLVHIISCQIAKVSSRCYKHHFLAATLEDYGCPPTWQLHTGLYNFAQNIPMNILFLEQSTHFKLEELSSLFIIYIIKIS